jgi:hypothetical protein
MSPPIDPDPPGLADSLDITGDWAITYSWAPEQEPVASPRLPTYHAHFEVTSRGGDGVVKFEGPFIDDPTAGPLPHSHAPAAQPGIFHGETLYDGRGVYLVQMVMYYDHNRYYELHCGRHMSRTSPEEVDGAYVDVGASRDKVHPFPQGYFGRFRMQKV